MGTPVGPNAGPLYTSMQLTALPPARHARARAVHEREYDLGEGKVFVLDAADDIGELPARLRKLVPPRMLELCQGFPGSFAKLASGVTTPAFAEWLESAGDASARIAVYDVRRGMPKKAFLELDFGERATAGGMLPWTVLVDALTGAPSGCPAPLAEVYDRIGGLATQYGASGTLISPPDAKPLDELGDSVAHLFDERLGAELTRGEARAWIPWYECDGDYLCYQADGRSRWFGFEWVEKRELVSTESCIEALFRALLAKENFHG